MLGNLEKTSGKRLKNTPIYGIIKVDDYALKYLSIVRNQTKYTKDKNNTITKDKFK